MKQNFKGGVAAGHPKTVEAATLILEEGGNAFDAVVAAHLAACVTEPVLASLGGGGYLLIHDGDSERLYDFFVQTPKRRPAGNSLDFFPITADFGTTCQEFHIGLGSIATPGVVKGLWRIHRQLGRLPLATVAQPAMEIAREGVVVNAFQAYIFDIVAPIYRARKETFHLYRSPADPRQLVREGDLLRQPQLADTIEALTREGEALFYQGEIAAEIARLCAGGGSLTREDLAAYRVESRKPLEIRYRGNRIVTNPPPSSGGILIAFALKLLEHCDLPPDGFGTLGHLQCLTRIQQITQQARQSAHLDETHEGALPPLLTAGTLQHYLGTLDHPLCRRGTTHISVIDAEGNCASLTTSNGEGCGHMIPGTGIMLNNMLGEEDLNPRGFNLWPSDTRMTSMMAPTLAFQEDKVIALGSGGSNRLRTAILQTLINLLDFSMPLEQAITAPRLHFEKDTLNLEAGFPDDVLRQLLSHYPTHHLWPGINLFFGGVHAVAGSAGGMEGFGDPRRGGCGAIA